MGLWAELKSGAAKTGGWPRQSGLNSEAQSRDREPGLQKMRQAWREISNLWDEIETSGGSLAWEWILRGSLHGEKIRAAEGRVNAIGSLGDPAALAAACDGLVNAWREGIEAWKRKAHCKKEA